ncbi:hypothetical protein BH11PSE9_BH11PSE9_24570 [soil metagenome]
MRPLSRKAARAAACVSLVFMAGHAAALTSYGLRQLSVDAGFTELPNGQWVNPTGSYSDYFANGDPLTGGAYTGATTPTPTYLHQGSAFSVGSEAAVNDYFGQNFGAGRLTLSSANAAPAISTADAPGTMGIANRITLNDPAAGSFLSNTQYFQARAFFDFATPDVGSYYGVRLTDKIGSAAYNDSIDLRVIQNGFGNPVLNLRRLTSSGGTDLNLFPLGNVAITSFLQSGKSLSDIAVIGLEFDVAPWQNGGLRAEVELLDGSNNKIGSYDFFDASNGAIYPQIFHGENFTHVAAGATWTVSSVPEPQTWAMLLAGLAGITWITRRRSRG